jgi:hypothetical protein
VKDVRQPGRDSAPLPQDPQEHVLRPEVVVSKIRRLPAGDFDDVPGAFRERDHER